MALSTLVVDKLEQFGGIDLKKNYRKYFSNALGVSIALHLMAILLYVGWSWYFTTEQRTIPSFTHDPAIFVAPPSTQVNPPNLSPIIPALAQTVMHPKFGIPVPIPDVIDPKLTLPDINRQSSVIVNAKPTLDLDKQSTANLNIQPRKAEPGIDDFIPVSVEPQETQPLEHLIIYPEVARRSGLEGTVIISALIGDDGNILKIVPQKWDYDIFKDAAIAAMMKEKFTPALQGRTPVSVWINRTVHFKLSDK